MIQQGHSDARVALAVAKMFPADKRGVGYAEYLWLRALGSGPAVAVLAAMESGYIMERLEPLRVDRHSPGKVLNLLRNEVWTRDECVGVAGVDNTRWRVNAESIFNVKVPAWVAQAAEDVRCCSHGDPTLSNVMQHGFDIQLIDPCHRIYTPETWGVDAGKVLQSMMGWEVVQSGWEATPWCVGGDEVWYDERNLRVALWWAGFHAYRIYQREVSSRKREHIMVWADDVVQQCWGVLGL